MKMIRLAVIVIVGFAVHSAAFAQSNPIMGQVQVQLNLTSGCLIDTGSGPGSSSDLGTIDFGTESSAFIGSLSAQATGSGSAPAQVTCSPDITAIQVTVDGGENAGEGASIGSGTRALANGSSYVPYEVYSDSAQQNQYAIGAAETVAVDAPGEPFVLPIYGVANKTSADALAAGLYTDVLSVTLGW